MIAAFDLERRLPTYDFFPWLTHVKLLGATECTIPHARKLFMRKKWLDSAETYKRLRHYITPGFALARMPWSFSEEGDREIGSHLHSALVADMQRLRCDLPRLETVLPPGRERFTVTIRHNEWKPERNSDGELWREFARRIGAYVFEEHDERPVPLHQRVAIYAGAKMNFGVPNGPLSLLWWTRYPVSMFCDPFNTVMLKDWRRQGMVPGDQVPWFLPNQRLIWETQNMDNLMREFDRVVA
jgi:hypothetical protein